MRYFVALIFIISLIGLTGCSRQPDRSVDDLLDSLSQKNTRFNVSLDVQFIGYAPNHYSVLVKGTLSNGENSIDPDTIEMFTNNRKMEYSVGVGNYYERYPAFNIDFHESHPLTDTLKFSIRLKGRDYSIGYLPVKSMFDFVHDNDLYKEITFDRTKPILINWGGSLPDSLTVLHDIVHKEENGSRTESSWITRQHWNPVKPFSLTQKIESNDSTENTFYLTWWKEGRGVSVNEKIGCRVNCVGKVEQRMK